MAVRIRLKKLGRKHRPFYRICAMDARTPRGGKVLEELGTYDPMIHDCDARAVMNTERIAHWLSVGALPTEKVGVLIKKYGPAGTHLEQQKSALERLAQPRAIPEPGQPASMPKSDEPAAQDTAAADADPRAEEVSSAQESAPEKEPPADQDVPTEEIAAEKPVSEEAPAEEEAKSE